MLPTADRQLAGEMVQKSVGDAEIAFGVLKVNRVDLVRHRGAADFTFLQLLLEEAHRDVAPNVAVEVDEHRVGALDFMEEFGHVVVRLDLNRVRVEGHAQTFFNDALAVCFPVVVGISDQMRIEVAHGAVHLGVELDGFDGFDDARQTYGNVGHFLADGRGTGGLAVGAGEHRNGSPAVREFADVVANGSEALDERLAAGREHQRVARVVDVFARAGKVHKFARLCEFLIVRDLFLDPVFHGLDVVVGARFDGLDFFAVAFREVVRETAQEGLAVGADRGEFGKTGFGKRNQPFDFDAHARIHESRFGKDAAKGFALTGIAAVKGAQGGKRGKCLHKCFLYEMSANVMRSTFLINPSILACRAGFHRSLCANGLYSDLPCLNVSLRSLGVKFTLRRGAQKRVQKRSKRFLKRHNASTRGCSKPAKNRASAHSRLEVRI